MTDTADSQGPTLRDYVRVIWRRKWVVIAFTVLGLGLALAYSHTRTPLYEATATLIYETPLNVLNPLSSSYTDITGRQIQLDSVASVITSPEVTDMARERITTEDIAVDYGLTVAPEETAGSSTSTGSTVLVTAVSAHAPTAAHVANAYAIAFTEYRKAQAQEQVRQASQAIQSQIDTFNTRESRQSAEYYTLLQRAQDLQILEATVTGNFRVLIPARTPSAPFSPEPKRNGALGIAAGLVLGIGLALVLEQFDTRVRTRNEASAIVGMPVIGDLRKLTSKALSEPLVVLKDPFGLPAEAIRKLRSNLEFADVDGDLKSLVITSALQHEGKSLMICNLALSLAAAGRRVVLVDADLRRPKVHHFLGLANREGVSSVLSGRTNLCEAMRPYRLGPQSIEPAGPAASARVAGSADLQVLTSGPLPPNPAEIIASRSFAAMIAELVLQADLVLVDSPAILAVGDTAAIARCVDGLVLLTDLTRAKRPVLEEAIRQIDQMPCRKMGLVVVSDAKGERYAHHYAYHAEGESLLDHPAGGDERNVTVRSPQGTAAGVAPLPRKGANRRST